MATKAKVEPKGSCDCFGKVNEELARIGSNTRLEAEFGINLNTGVISPPRVKLGVVKEKKSRETLKSVIAAYCPFCGKEYRP